mgnify:CR=1 FL=1
MSGINNDVISKLSASALSALMAHLGQDTTVNNSSSSDSDSSSSDGPSDGITQKIHATDGLDVDKFQHARNVNAGVDEQFGMSQFWYTTETAEKLAREALSLGGKVDEYDGIKRIAFVSCPSAYKSALDLFERGEFDPDEYDVYIFEYDTRFGDVYGEQFVFFDFNTCLFHEEHINSFDFVMADPPYLVDTCMQKTIDAMVQLRRDEDTPMGFCTGTVMSESIYNYGKLRESKFHPEHASKLGNEFSYFTNYECPHLDGWYPLEELKKDFCEDYFQKTARTRVQQNEAQ